MYNSEQQNVLIEKALEQVLGRGVENLSLSTVGGGSINQAFVAHTGENKYFLKSNNLPTTKNNLFVEVKGLDLLRANTSLTVPSVIGQTQVEETHFLVLEFLGDTPRNLNYWEVLGIGIGELHRSTASSFGLEYDNYIGSLEQLNDRCENWTEFFIEQRLVVQIKLARDQGLMSIREVESFESFYRVLNNLIPQENPSLLHGDLWNGNIHIGNTGEPAIIDPAVYYGHREMDIAFTHMFGGFDREFYGAYNSVFPLEPGFRDRIEIHNLYPGLVHLNLFGRGYWSAIERTLDRFT